MLHRMKDGQLSILCSLLLCIAIFPLSASEARSAVVDFRVAVLPAPSPGDSGTSVPISQTSFGLGSTMYLELWVQTNDINGLSSASVDLTFNSSLATALGVTHTATFSTLTNHAINNAGGLIDDLSGSHLGPCSDAVGVAGNWARAAIVEFTVVASGLLTLQSASTGSPVYGTAICGGGDVDPAQISYGSVVVALGDDSIPAVSQWGTGVLILLVLTAATILIRARRSSMMGPNPSP